MAGELRITFKKIGINVSFYSISKMKGRLNVEDIDHIASCFLVPLNQFLSCLRPMHRNINLEDEFNERRDSSIELDYLSGYISELNQSKQ